ncbi:MAG: DUF885 family protein, partial [Arenimonas sp.]
MSLRLAIALALSVAAVGATAAPLPAAAPASTASVAAKEPAWVTRSNAITSSLLRAQAKFSPEGASSAGMVEYDGLASDLGPGINERYVAAMQVELSRLKALLATETDPQVRQDIQILVGSVEDDIEGTRLGDKYRLPWMDVPQMVFGNVQGLLDAQLPAARQAKALELLQRYTGLYPGSTPMTELAKARFTEKLSNPALLYPVKARVERSLNNVPTYIKGIRELFAKLDIQGAGPALDAMDKQLSDYAAWERKAVLPKAREDFRLPPELYAFRLKGIGIDIDP